MAEIIERVFLVVIRAEPGLPPGRVVNIVGILKTMSGNRTDLAFNTGDATFLGIVVKSNRDARQIRAALEPEVPLKGRDFILVLSLDDNWSAIGNSAGWRHIQAMLGSAT